MPVGEEPAEQERLPTLPITCLGAARLFRSHRDSPFMIYAPVYQNLSFNVPTTVRRDPRKKLPPAPGVVAVCAV